MELAKRMTGVGVGVLVGADVGVLVGVDVAAVSVTTVVFSTGADTTDSDLSLLQALIANTKAILESATTHTLFLLFKTQSSLSSFYGADSREPQ